MFRRSRVTFYVERRHGRLLKVVAERAHVVFSEGETVVLPAALFTKAKIAPGGLFVLVTTRRSGGEIVRVVVVALSERGGDRQRMGTPKVYVRHAGRVTTRH